MEIVVAAVITVLGWLATYRLTVRANRRLFIDTIVNSARLEVTAAIRDYQKWLSSVNSRALVPPFFPTDNDRVAVEYRNRVRTELSSLFFDNPSALLWSFRLEEYQILFPYTANARRALFERHSRLRSRLEELFQRYTAESAEPVQAPATENQDLLELIGDQIGLFEDLRVHLQNRTLAALTTSQVPLRVPRDIALPRLVEMPDGDLQVIAGGLIYPTP